MIRNRYSAAKRAKSIIFALRQGAMAPPKPLLQRVALAHAYFRARIDSWRLLFVITIMVIIGVGFIASPVWAVNYLSGYTNYNNSYPINFGSKSNYIRNFGGGGRDSRHNAEYQRLAEKTALETRKNQYYNKNPPCGTYGRLPEKCRRGFNNVAKRN